MPLGAERHTLLTSYCLQPSDPCKLPPLLEGVAFAGLATVSMPWRLQSEEPRLAVTPCRGVSMCSRNVSKLGGMLASTMSGSFDEMGTNAMSSVASSYGISTDGSRT